jgi:restriction system protein
MLSPDEYGNMSEDPWNRHLNTFIKKTLLPDFQRRMIDHLLANDPKRHLGRLRSRIDRIVDRYR